MYSRLTTFTKTLPQMSFNIFFYYFVRSGAPPMTLLTAGAVTDPQLPATVETCAPLMHGYAGARSRIGMVKKRMLDLVPIWKDRGINKDRTLTGVDSSHLWC